MSPQTARNRVNLADDLEAHPKVGEMVDAKELPQDTAREIVREHKDLAEKAGSRRDQRGKREAGGVRAEGEARDP